MRLWSLHPCYLDSRGLVALWREGLLARKVLQNRTKGYRNHPQLERFKSQPDPVALIDRYLQVVLEEAVRREYRFEADKIGAEFSSRRLTVTVGQLRFELEHLKQKLRRRDFERFTSLENIVLPQANPIFIVVDGDMESWERGG